jgi:hypothetical protein
METATPGKFPEFQKKIFPVVEYLTSKREYAKHTFTKQWTALKRIPNNPMTADITWRNLKILLDIKDMSQYRDFLVQCPDFTKAVQLRNSKTTRSGFDFGVVPNLHLPTFTPLSSPIAKDEEETSYVFDVDISREDIEEKPPAVPDIVTNPTTDQAKYGTDVPIDITTPKQPNVTAIQDTKSAVDTDGSLTSDDLSMPDTEYVHKDVSKMNTLQHRLQQMTYKFDSYMQKFDSRLADTDSRITSYEVNLMEQLNRASSRFASSATRHYNSLTEYASKTFTTFQNNLTACMEQFLDTQRSKIRDMHTANKVKIEFNVMKLKTHLMPGWNKPSNVPYKKFYLLPMRPPITLMHKWNTFSRAHSVIIGDMVYPNHQRCSRMWMSVNLNQRQNHLVIMKTIQQPLCITMIPMMMILMVSPVSLPLVSLPIQILTLKRN